MVVLPLVGNQVSGMLLKSFTNRSLERFLTDLLVEGLQSPISPEQVMEISQAASAGGGQGIVLVPWKAVSRKMTTENYSVDQNDTPVITFQSLETAATPRSDQRR